MLWVSNAQAASCSFCNFDMDRFNPSNAGATFIQSTGMQRFFKPSRPFHVCIHWIALAAEYSQMSTHVPGFQSFFRFLHYFV